MGEKEDKEKAEKLAAAKKRVAQLQKKKKAATGGEGSSTKSKGKPKAKEEANTDEPAAEAVAEDDNAADAKDNVEEEEPVAAPTAEQDEPTADETVFNDAIKAAATSREESGEGNEAASSSPEPKSSSRMHPVRQPSISLQSKMRSASFRQGPLSPLPITTPEDGDLPDIYRKQVTRIEELESENKRLAHEAQDWEARWRKTEDTLEVLREKTAEEQGASNDGQEVQKLRAEVNTLRRNSRQSISMPRIASPVHSDDALRKELDGKDSTITGLQLEISRLRTQIAASSADSSAADVENAHTEQITALQQSLARLESTNARLESELADSKARLTRASEKALKETTEQTSRETRVRELERQLQESDAARTDAQKRSETLDKKLDALNKLHRESEARNLPKLNGFDALQKELAALRAKLESAERETARLREARKKTLSGAGANDDAGLDELEDEERQRLEKKIRDLEAENFDLRRGVWRDRRRDLQPNLSGDNGAGEGEFDDVDLNGSAGVSRKGSALHTQPQQKHSGFTQVLNSGLAAFRGSATSPDHSTTKTRPRNDSLLEDFDDDAFDEGAFAAAQREEEMKKMVEHVREVKKGLKQWVGWRLDLVDLRRSGGGIGFGDVFDL